MFDFLCKYKDYFGKPGEGSHSYRFLNLAIVDVILTIIGSYIISRIFNYSFLNTTIFLFILAIIMHKIFCVDTTLNLLIFGQSSKNKQ